MRTTVGFAAAVIAVIALGGCGGSDHGLRSPVTPLQRMIADRQHASICGDALAQVMQRAFISPSSSPAVRLHARKTLAVIAAHRASIEPVCASRASVAISGRPLPKAVGIMHELLH